MMDFEPNHCNAPLKDGVFDEHDVYGSDFQTKVFLKRFCWAHFTSFEQASSHSLNLGVPIKDFFASLAFDYAQRTFTQGYQTLCSHQDSFSQSNQINREVIRVAKANLAQAFTECVNQQIFTAFVEPTDPKQFQIAARRRPPIENTVAKVQSLTFDPPSIGSCGKPRKTIPPSTAFINCSRNDQKSAVQVAL